MNLTWHCRNFILASCPLFALLFAPGTSSQALGDEAGKFFETKIRPLLVEHCFACHGPDSEEGEANLRLDSRESLLRGGDSGPAAAPGNPDGSLLMLAVRHDTSVAAMPPKYKLKQAEVDALAAWVKMGAPWPSANTEPRPASSAQTEAGVSEWDEEARNFWAYQPVKEPKVPEVKDAAWPQSPIDHFILTRLEAANVKPAPPATKRKLIRRATLDLLGVPPSPAEIDAFLQDDSPDAFARVIDRLLASPQYGERWGRHWLDLARYTDSNGMDDNLVYSDAWRYRDYVIAAFNSDKPYDRFLTEQLAGDLLVKSEPQNRAELLTATGFLAIGAKMLAEDDPVKQQMDIVDEQIDTTSRVFLALTVSCARCHDHKFDPVSLKDYYSLAGIFKSTRTMMTFRVDSKWTTTALESMESALRLKDLERIIDVHDNVLVNGLPNKTVSDEERAAHSKLLGEAYAEYAKIPKAMTVEEGPVEDLEVFLRGNHLTRGELAKRGFPTIIAGFDQPPLPSTSSGRLELAQWIASPENPLTARVMVNRIWRWHFGRGIVRSVDNFGKLGQLPSNPELLDWLATQFVKDGWSIKKMHKHIMTSSAYQMSTEWNEQAAQVDPENELLWRMPRLRMDAEALRDSLLSVSGLLDSTMGGISLPNTKPFQNLSGGVAGRTEHYQTYRRSVYLPILRSAVYDQFLIFDFPDPAMLNGDRLSTTVAAQALFMMNGPLMQDAPRKLVEQIMSSSNSDIQQQLQLASALILGRPAEADELAEWEAFLKQYQATAALKEEDPEKCRKLAWEGLCRVLFSTNEFIYID